MKKFCSSFSLLLYALILLCVNNGFGTGKADRNIIFRRGVEEFTHDQEIHKSTHHHVHAGSSHMDLSVMVFFTLKDLKVGKRIPIYFPKKNPLKSPQFIPREEANSIPFTSKQLPFLLKFFSFTNGSPQAKAMEETLTGCETEAIKGETKICATSLESMLDFAKSVFGSKFETFKILTTTHFIKSKLSDTHFQNYTVVEVPHEKPAPKMVACHTMPYPYAIMYCHSQVSETKVFKVSLEGDNGDKVDAVAVCHMDTSQWSRNHVSFRVLRIEPGSSHVCHFFPADHLVMVPKLVISSRNEASV